MRLLVIDHHDSYSHLLHHLFWSLTREEPLFLVAEQENLGRLNTSDFDAAILSPGPGHPAQAEDFGATLDFLLRFSDKPMLGICLGHQGMAYACGATIRRLNQPWHGKACTIRHVGTGLFAGLPQGFTAIRYHSLTVSEENLPRHLHVTAYAEEDSSVQGLRFADRPWHGLQFHPESIGTALGPDLAKRFLQSAHEAQGKVTAHSQAAPPLQPPTREQPPPTPSPAKASISLPVQATPTQMFEAMRSLAVEKGWAHFWLDPQSVQSVSAGQAMPGIPRAWPATVMGLASHALELYPWGIVLVECTSQKQLATWRGHPLQGLEMLRQMRPGVGLSQGNLDQGLADFITHIATHLSPLDWVGHLHYELGALCQDSFAGWLDSLPAQQGLGCFLLPDYAFTLEMREGENPTWHVSHHSEYHGKKDLESCIQDLLHHLVEQHKKAGQDNPAVPAPISPLPIDSHLSRAAYAQAFSRIQTALHAGDTYEACLTFTCKLPGTGLAETTSDNLVSTYLALRNLNPAPFGAFVATPSLSLLSATPELFLSASPHEGNMRVASRPIKGTRARGADPVADAAQKNALSTSPKDRAENLMITDLVRNDLARICEPGSVQVTSLHGIETHPRVFQMVSEVSGNLRKGLGLAACLQATFPGGSMTGAPKQRTMQILHELEGRPREAYSGAMGTLSADGCFTLAMVIRTWVVDKSGYAAGCGGAIVVDSQEESEWQEAWLKIAVLRQAYTRHFAPNDSLNTG